MVDSRKLWLAGGIGFAVLAAGCETGPVGVDEGLDQAPVLTEVPTTTEEVCKVIDFEDQQYANGALITTIPSGFGFDLDVTVELDAAQDVHSVPEARIFNANANTPTNDDDLRDDAVGGDCPDCGPLNNLLIVQQDLGTLGQPAIIPDDSHTGGRIVFSGFTGHGEFFMKSFVAIDDDIGEPTFEARVDGTTVLSPTSSGTGDGTVETVVITTPHTFTSQFSFNLKSSGAADNIEICQTIMRGGEGCTPGYWKVSQHWDSWPVGYVPQTTTFGDVFSACTTLNAANPAPPGTNICDLSLLGALSLGGGAQNALARHAVAAILNAASGDVAYHYTVAEVQQIVNDAIASGDYETAKNSLAFWNETTPCPLN